MDKYQILAVKWRSARHTVGFVAYATGNPTQEGEWNSVVGYLPRLLLPTGQLITNDDDDELESQYIAAHGAKLSWQEAEVFFPELDITKHKYYER